MAQFAKFKQEETLTTIYGVAVSNGVLEFFATHPYGCGASTDQLGMVHLDQPYEQITRAEINVAWLLNVSEDELPQEDLTATFTELVKRYPNVDEPDWQRQDEADALKMDMFVEMNTQVGA